MTRRLRCLLGLHEVVRWVRARLPPEWEPLLGPVEVGRCAHCPYSGARFPHPQEPPPAIEEGA